MAQYDPQRSRSRPQNADDDGPAPVDALLGPVPEGEASPVASKRADATPPKKAVAKKLPAKKVAAKKVATKKVTAKKAAKKTSTETSPAKKSPAKKAPAKKAAPEAVDAPVEPVAAPGDTGREASIPEAMPSAFDRPAVDPAVVAPRPGWVEAGSGGPAGRSKVLPAAIAAIVALVALLWVLRRRRGSSDD